MDLVLTLPDPSSEDSVRVGFEKEVVSETRVIEVVKGKPVRLERTFKKCVDVKNSPLLSGRDEKKTFEDGKTFAVERKGEGFSVRVSGPGPGTQEKVPPEVRTRIVRDAGLKFLEIFPTGKVAPGSSWEKSGPELLVLLPGVPVANFREGSAAFRFSGIVQEGIGRVAKVEIASMKVSLDGGPGGARLDLEVKGTLRFALDKGWILGLDLKGKVELGRDVEGVTGSGSVKLSRKVTFSGK